MLPLIYLLFALPLTILEYLKEEWWGIGVAFAFPWSVTLVVISGLLDRDVGFAWTFPSIALNGVIFYAVSKLVNRK